MGDLAVDAQSGRGEPEGRPVGHGDPAATVDQVEAGGAERAQDGEDVIAPEAKPDKPRSFWKELPLLVGIALVLALIIKTFLLQAFSIPSDSMQNTLQPGDRVLVDKLTPWFGSKPERGEVVVFHDPDNWLSDEPVSKANDLQKVLSFVGLMPSADERDLIKRVIAVGGDTVECRGTAPLKVNGHPLTEPYVFAGNTPCSDDNQGGRFKVVVPKGKIWVMGDHRQNSADSRYHQQSSDHGFVPVGNVVGRAVVIAWPPGRLATLPVPATFDEPGVKTAAGAAPAVVALAAAFPPVLLRRRKRRDR